MTITKQDTSPTQIRRWITPAGGDHFGRFRIGQVCCEGGNNNKIPF